MVNRVISGCAFQYVCLLLCGCSGSEKGPPAVATRNAAPAVQTTAPSPKPSASAIATNQADDKPTTKVEPSSPAVPEATPTPPFDIGAKFTASGWMGDIKGIELKEADTTNPHSGPSSIKVNFKPGFKGWGGVYWQYPPDNWGDKPGEDLSKSGYTRLTFWARGAKGGELVEFKAGGIANDKKPHKDSFEANLGKVTLTSEWKQYSIDLIGKNLSNVIGGFCWVASKSGNPGGLSFWLDDIEYTTSPQP